MVKGNNHKIYNNTVLNSGSKNNIIVLQIYSSDHLGTIVRNNAADKIANHRTNDVAIDFGIYSNNWNGYNESGHLNSILADTSNNGSGPDIGAYEYGNTDWTVSTTFCSSWIPIHSVSISGNSGYRMLCSPVPGTIMSDLLDDIDFDGVSNLPVDLYVSSAHNTGNVSIGGIPENSYYLAGNPYTKTLDWDNISKTNLSSSVSVWDDASSTWETYNGLTGDLTNGLIAPFQGFWVQASGGIGSFTIQAVDIATAAGTFRGRTTDTDSSGYILITATMGEWVSTTYMTFTNDADAYHDNGDAKKLLPLEATPRIAAMSIIEDTPYKINNLPLSIDSVLMIPVDILILNPDTANNFVIES